MKVTCFSRGVTWCCDVTHLAAAGGGAGEGGGEDAEEEVERPEGGHRHMDPCVTRRLGALTVIIKARIFSVAWCYRFSIAVRSFYSISAGTCFGNCCFQLRVAGYPGIVGAFVG